MYSQWRYIEFMPKATVYLSDELSAAARSYGISLSPICQLAIEAELRRCRAAKEARADLIAVATRLIRTKSEGHAQDFAGGFELGARWARDHATIAELDELEAMVRSGATSIVLDQDHSLPVFLTGQFWHADPAPAAFTRLGEGAFDRGVLAGAVEVFEAVQPYLELHASGTTSSQTG
jgi:post-segregation antitoxin (ccd killing protein)